MTESDKRPWVAAVLALAYPGMGHVYLRKWGRALLWFGLIISIPVLLLPTAAIPADFTVESFLDAAQYVPLYVPVLVVIMTGLSMLDAYRMAIDYNERVAARQRGEVMYCPSCGKELDDPNLDFCQWCAEPLDETTSEDDSGLTPW